MPEATSGEPPKKSPNAHQGWRAPEGTTTAHELPLATGAIQYNAVADWMTLYQDDIPHAAMFHTAYLRTDIGEGAPRPLTFLFNGGPGAASAFLHIGAIGPVRVAFAEGGAAPQPPVVLEDNLESWLAFTDLVFIDPIATGFSRLLSLEGAEKDPARCKEETKEFWEVQRDLDALSEFIWRFMSKYKRWTSPIFVAGESYGGFRAACLAKHLQSAYGIALNGIYLISPAIELSSLIASDYNVLGFCDVFPSMVATAHHHDKIGEPYRELSLDALLQEAEQCATEETRRAPG